MAPKRKLPVTVDATDRESRPKRVLRSSKTTKDESKPEAAKSQVADRPTTAKVQRPKTPKAKPPTKPNAHQADKGPPLGTTSASRSELPNYCKKEDRAYWLMKAEPNTRLENGVDIRFSIDDLASKTKPEPWDGIRNHVAKNNLLAMRKGDYAFFYHSNCKVS